MGPQYFLGGFDQPPAEMSGGFQGFGGLVQPVSAAARGLTAEGQVQRSNRSAPGWSKTQKWMLYGLPPNTKVGLIRSYFSQFIGNFSVRFMDPGLCELSDSEEVSNQCVVEPLVGVDLQALSERIAGSTLAGRSLSLVKYLSHNKLRKHNSKYNERAIRVKKVPKHMADIDYVRDLLEFQYGYVENIYCIQRAGADGPKLPFYQKRYEDEYKSFAVTMCAPDAASLAVSEGAIVVYDSLGKAHTIKVESYQPAKNKLQTPAQQLGPVSRDSLQPGSKAINSIPKHDRSTLGKSVVTTSEGMNLSNIPKRKSNHTTLWPDHSQRDPQYSNSDAAGFWSADPGRIANSSPEREFFELGWPGSSQEPLQSQGLPSQDYEQSNSWVSPSELYGPASDSDKGWPVLLPQTKAIPQHYKQGFAKVGSKLNELLTPSLHFHEGELQILRPIIPDKRPNRHSPEEFEATLSKPNLHRYFDNLKYRAASLDEASNYRMNVQLECTPDLENL